jgi:hypothetical protein
MCLLLYLNSYHPINIAACSVKPYICNGCNPAIQKSCIGQGTPRQSSVLETGCIYASVSCYSRSIDHNVSTRATQTYISKARTTIDKKTAWRNALRSGLWPLSGWDCGFESRRWHGYVFCERCALSGRGHCVGLITLLQRTATKCGVSEWDREGPIG